MDAELVPTGQSSLESLEAHALEAMIAVENVTTPDQADELLRKITAYQQAVKLAKYGQEQERRWARIKLEAERKMGELLGDPEPGGDHRSKQQLVANKLEETEHQARHKARKVAAVPEPIFREYLDEAEAPSRAGLLRAAKTQIPPAKTKRPTVPTSKPQRQVTGEAKRLLKSIANQANSLAAMATDFETDFRTTDQLLREMGEAVVAARQGLSDLNTTLKRGDQ